MENLYDYRDDPFDGCDFAGNTGCPGSARRSTTCRLGRGRTRRGSADEAARSSSDRAGPDLLLVQEAEDQDICTVTGGALTCGTTDNADGKPDTLQELALAVAAAGGPAYDAAYDRDGADDRGIIAAFLYRTDRLSLAAAPAPARARPTPGVSTGRAALAYNADVQNPKALNAVLPADVDTLHRRGRLQCLHPGAAGGASSLVAAAPGAPEAGRSVGDQQPLLVRPGRPGRPAAGAGRLRRGHRHRDPGRRPERPDRLRRRPERLPAPRRPDRRRPTRDTPSDQLAPLYDAGLHNLWDNLVADVPSAGVLVHVPGPGPDAGPPVRQRRPYGDLSQMRAAHVNAGLAGRLRRRRRARGPATTTRRWPGSSPGRAVRRRRGGGRGQLRHHRRSSRCSCPGRCPSRSLVCAATLGLTASDPSDYDGVAGARSLAAGATSLTFTVTVKGDKKREADETVRAARRRRAVRRLADPLAIGTILNDD